MPSIFHDILPEATLAEKYRTLKKYPWAMQNNIDVFGPYPESEVPWDISEAQKIVIYNKKVSGILTWLKREIVNTNAMTNYKTLDVLIRITTGMLNKCDIPKEMKIMFEDNMIMNLKKDYAECILSDLPF